MFVTVFLDAQNRNLIIPNAKIMSDKIKNFSVERFSRLDIDFAINYAG
ncbi:mechanosensitive ion channel domain-containing protein [Bacteroidetes bacterium endosymbiont of Geopemphigus sp.]